MTQATTARSQDLIGCRHCLKLSPRSLTVCPRCGAGLRPRSTANIQITLALVLAACVLYVPANLYPIMHTLELGASETSTIIGGVILLAELGSFAVAAVIFLFSIVVPTGKILALLYLVWSVRFRSRVDQHQRTLVYEITEFIGKWSMVDVFVVAVLGALVHLTGVLVIEPGVAAVSFAGVVILTMLAAESFDTRLIWDELERSDDG